MIIRKSAKELSLMRKAGKIVALVLEELQNFSKPGVSTLELDRIASCRIEKEGAKAAFLGYQGFPASICVSINEEVVHGIPKKRKLKESDLLSIDVGVNFDGYYADAALTIAVGEIDDETNNLIKVAKQALYDGINQAQVGNNLFDISATIQKQAEGHGYSVVRDFVGHGIGQKLHEDPQIPNYGEFGKGPILKEGMVLALEPMINQGGFEVEIKSDNWTVVTKDSKLSAHFEHTVAVTKDGPKIITLL